MGAIEGRRAATAFRAAAQSPLITRWLAKLDEMSGWTIADVDSWQRQRAARLLGLNRRLVPAYRHGPAYRTSPWSSLPVLTKDDVRGNPQHYSNRRVPHRSATTGGTGGRPLAINIGTASFFSEWAHIAFAWRTAGVRITDPKITFRGSSLGRGFSESPVFYQPTYNHVVVSPFHLNDATFRKVLESARELRPQALWGYPSAITPFARWVERTGPHPELSSVRGVLLASEGAFDWQVELFRTVFDAQVVRWYGQSEKVAFASGCPTTPGYHVLPTYGLVEVLDDRIIGTGFTNWAMPLVRYDTEDKALPGQSSCSCSLPFPWISGIAGRWDQSLLWGAGDEPISTSALNFHDPLFLNFDQFQFRQHEAGRALLLVTESSSTSGTTDLLAAARHVLQQRVGAQLTIDVEVARPEELLSSRGKLVAVDQRYSPASDLR